MTISKKTLIFFIILFLILNFVFIYKNYRNNYTINELQFRIRKLELINNNLINSNIDKELKLDLEQLGIEGGKMVLLTLIKENVCGSCLINEIKYLNDIYSKYNDHIKVYYEGYNSKITELGANFEIHEVVNISEKFQLPENIIDNPASFVIDNNGYIILYHKATPGLPESSAEFYKKVSSIFNSVYEK